MSCIYHTNASGFLCTSESKGQDDAKGLLDPQEGVADQITLCGYMCVSVCVCECVCVCVCVHVHVCTTCLTQGSGDPGTIISEQPKYILARCPTANLSPKPLGDRNEPSWNVLRKHCTYTVSFHPHSPSHHLSAPDRSPPSAITSFPCFLLLWLCLWCIFTRARKALWEYDGSHHPLAEAPLT